MQNDKKCLLALTYKFTGKPYSSSAQLQYNYQRWYDQSTGRFVSQDPLAGYSSEPQSLNRYAYAENQPTGLTDPSGMYAGDYGYNGNLQALASYLGQYPPLLMG